MSLRPKLLVQTLVSSGLADVQNHGVNYIGQDGVEYMVYVGTKTDADTDSIYITKIDVTAAAGYTTTQQITGLTKYKQYTFTNHNNRVYITNGTDLVRWLHVDSSGTITDGYLDNAPIGEYVISAKNRLFMGGTTTDYYITGTATFTQNSFVVSGTDTEWGDNARAGDQIANATEYTTGTAAFTKGSKTVTGTTTVWSTNVSVGDWIKNDTDDVYYQVASIASNTSLTLTKEYEEAGGAAAAYTAITPASTWYTIAKVTSDTSITLTEQFNETTDSGSTYFLRRISEDVIYWSAEECLNDWQTTGIVGGDDPGLIKINAPNTGIHNFNDAVIFFTKTGGEFILGTDTSTWTIPQQMRLPVGCVSHRSIISKDGWLGFMSKQGYFISKGGSLNLTDLGMTSFSDSIIEQINDIDPNRYELITASIWKDTLLISVPSQETYDEDDIELGYSTGTVTVSDADTAVAGTDTAWRGTIKPYDQIQFTGTDTTWYTITTVTSNTAIVLDRNKDGAVTDGTYKIRKRRNNRILAIDTRTNVDRKVSYGWTVYDNINANAFVVVEGRAFYASSTSGYLYEFDTGGTFYGNAITASARTGAWCCGKRYEGVRKFFKAFIIRAKGTGTVYITPYIDGVAGTQVSYAFTDTENYEEVYFPRTGHPFSGIGYEIEFLIECTGSNEDIVIKRPQVGFVTLKRQ